MRNSRQSMPIILEFIIQYVDIFLHSLVIEQHEYSRSFLTCFGLTSRIFTVKCIHSTHHHHDLHLKNGKINSLYFKCH